MKFKGIYTAMMAVSLIAAPTLAAAAPVATPLTQPATETVDGDNAFAGSSLVIALLAVAAIGGGIAAAASNNDNDTSPAPVTPTSP